MDRGKCKAILSHPSLNQFLLIFIAVSKMGVIKLITRNTVFLELGYPREDSRGKDEERFHGRLPLNTLLRPAIL